MSSNADIPERVQILGTRGSSVAYTIRDFLQRSDVPFDWIELTSDDDARTKAGVGSLADPRLPICIFHDRTRIEHPTIRQITEKLGWFHDPSRAEYDLAIYGAGPAGLECCGVRCVGRAENRSNLMLNGNRPASWPLDRNPYYLETSMPGMFAAGDVRHGSIKRCASAVGEGAMAVAFVHRYLGGS